MARIRVPQDALYGGVSTQPETQARAQQCKVADNVLLTVQRGVEKRSPLTFVANVNSSLYDKDDEFRIHWINRDPTERYMILYGENGIEVFDSMTGTEYPVVYSGDTESYVSASAENLILRTVADTTQIVNKTIACQTIADNDADNFGIAMFNGDLIGTYSSPEDFPSGAADKFYFADNKWRENNDTDSSINSIELLSGYYKYNSNAEDYKYEDGSAFPFERRFVKVPEDLPKRSTVKKWSSGQEAMETPVYVEVLETGNGGPIGWRKGTAADSNSDGTPDSDAEFSYERFPQPEVSNCYLDASTMPVKMTRKQDNAGGAVTGVPFGIYFEIEENDWTPRYAGDDELNALPSFVNNTINDLTFFRNRMVIATGENLVFSESGDFFNFFLNDYTGQADSERIDVALSTDGVTEILHLSLYAGNLVVFARGGYQFEVRSGDQPLSARTITFENATKFDISPDIEPTSGGRQLYFMSDRGVVPTLYEYYNPNSFSAPPNDALRPSAHVEQYIPSGITEILSDDENQTVVLFNGTNRNELYIYKYFWQGQTKVQSAWSRMVLPIEDMVMGGYVYDDSLYLLVMQESSGVITTSDGSVMNPSGATTVDPGTEMRLVKMSLKPVEVTEGLNFDPYLDNRVMLSKDETVDIFYDRANDETQFTVDFYDESVLRLGASSYAFVVTEGAQIGAGNQFDRVVLVPGISMTFIAKGRWNEGDVYVGRTWETRWTPHRPFLREGDGGVIDLGSNTIRLLNVQHLNTGEYDVEVIRPLGTTSRQTFSPIMLGGPSASLAPPQLSTGNHKFNILSQANQAEVSIVSTTLRPMNIVSMEWLIVYNERTR